MKIMKISTILDYVDSGQFALPEFQRGYVWNREQIRGLFKSLYMRNPIGGLLVWTTDTNATALRGHDEATSNIATLLLDGQQRITTLYAVLRGEPPRFFDGNPAMLKGLHFHLGTEEFEYYQPIKMKDDPLWVDVTALMKASFGGVHTIWKRIADTLGDTNPNHLYGAYMEKLHRLLGISDIDLHVDEVTGKDKSLDAVVEIFNCVNSGGTKLSKGDLALAKICANWTEARETMKEKLGRWNDANFKFDLVWLLRSVNAVLSGTAQFSQLDSKSEEEIKDGLNRACKHIDSILNIISGTLGLDHDRVLFGRYGIPVMVRYWEQKPGSKTSEEQDKLLFWYVQAAMWGRFSVSTETAIERSLAVLNGSGNDLDALIEDQRLWHNFHVEPSHFDGWTISARYLSRALHAYSNGRGTGLGNKHSSKIRVFGQDESTRSSSHISDFKA